MSRPMPRQRRSARSRRCRSTPRPTPPATPRPSSCSPRPATSEPAAVTQTAAPPVETTTARVRRASTRGRPGWVAFVLAAALVVAPVVAVLAHVTSGSWPELPANLGDMVVTTMLLMLGVGVGTLVLGCGLAWLVTAHTFPLRDVFVWLLVLPLAMPAYIL